MQSFFKFSTMTLLSAALCGCSAVDRIQNIGSAPKRRQWVIPPEQDRGRDPGASAHLA